MPSVNNEITVACSSWAFASYSHPALSQAGTALRRISLVCACACLFSVKLLGRCLTVCLHWWSAREALLLLIHVARRSYIAIAYPPSCSGACFLVYRLHALHAGTALVIAYLCCRRDRLPLSRGNRSMCADASCFSFLPNMLCDEGTICLRKECLSELLLETEFLVQT